VHGAAEAGATAEHTVPHPPQWLLSVCSLTHVPLQKDSPDEQAHWPLWHGLPVQAPHVAPAVPHIDAVWLV
jgi:hypothetical protein